MIAPDFTHKRVVGALIDTPMVERTGVRILAKDNRGRGQRGKQR